jgi:helicase
LKHSAITAKLMELLGYKTLYPPQAKALEAGVEEGHSIVVATPTASGKTFIGLTAIANRLSSDGGRAFYTTPLRSVAMEKYREFKVLESMGYSVGISIGDFSEGRVRGDVVVTTYEKLDSILRNEPEIAKSITVIVIDEIHYVGDVERGPTLESLISRILSLARRPQLVGLSATVPNAIEIAEWLGAKLVVDTWRPVPLHEGVYWGGVIKYSDGRERSIKTVSGLADVDLAIDCSSEGGQTLVFSQSRRRVVQLALRALKFADKLNFDLGIARETSERLLDSGGPRALREELSQLVARGVAYHHAGLSSEQRRLIEDAFRNRGLAVIYATPTLAAGVNLPARRVVVDEYTRFEEGVWKPISVAEYKQLAGRAGRPGLDPYGEAVIVAKPGDTVEELLEYYILGEVERVESKLRGLRGLRHMILGLVASGFTETIDGVSEVLSKTLYAFQSSSLDLRSMAERAVKDLVSWGLLEDTGGGYRATLLGYEVSKNYVDPESVPRARVYLSKLRELDELELLTLVSMMPDMTTLPVTRREEDGLIDRILDLKPKLVDVIDWSNPREVRGVKVALILYDWVEEAPEDDIARRYNVGPGDVAVLVDNASWIASSLSRILPHLGAPEWVSERLRVLEGRIEHGVKQELLPLVAIPRIGRVRARRLYQAGYRTLHDLMLADPEKLLRIQGIGPSIVKTIMEFLGRSWEPTGDVGKEHGKGLEKFME